MRILRRTGQSFVALLLAGVLLSASVAFAQSSGDQKKARKLYEEARAAYDKGNYDQAVQKYLESLKLNPKDDEAYYGLGLAYSKLKRLKEAADAFRQALAVNPQNQQAKQALQKIEAAASGKRSAEVKRLYNEGNTLMKKGEYEAALEKYKQAIALDSTHYRAYYGMGLAYKKLRRWEDAIAAFRKAISINKTYDKAIFALGKTLADLDRKEEALKVYKEAIAANPANAKAYYEMGRILLQQKKYAEAADAFRKATQIKPDYYLAYTSLGIALKQMGKYADAVQALENAVSFNPKYYQAYYRLAEVYNTMGKHEKALEAAKKCLSLRRGRYAPAAFEAGRAAQALGRTQEAIKYYQMAAKNSRWRALAEYQLKKLRGEL